MRSLGMIVLAAALLTGCEGINDAVVRRWHQDLHFGSQVNDQIGEGYRRRMQQPPPPPGPVAPARLDEG